MRRAIWVVVVAACTNPSISVPDGPPSFQDVTNDPANTSGMHFATQPFDVPQGVEIQDCYFMNMPDLNNGQPYYVDRVRLGTNPGSHHMNVFRVNTIVNLGTPAQGDFVHGENGMGECFKSGNWGDWPLVANTQVSSATNPYYDWHLPSGVAYKFTPGERIMVQTHYVNASTQTTPFRGKVVIDLYRSTLASPMEMGTLFATEQSIRVCRSNPTPSYHGACSFKNSGVTIAAANGHFHSRGVEFDVFKWDGVSTTDPPASSRFYQSLNWSDPPMTVYSDPTGMQIPANGGIWWQCDYQWIAPSDAAGGCAAVDARDKQMAGDCCYTFGPIVETSEHCNVFLYYYPKVADAKDIACF